MRIASPLLSLLLGALIVSGCASTPTSEKNPPGAAEAKKSKVHVTAKFLSYHDMQDFAQNHPDLNERLLKVAPTMAYRPGTAQGDVIPLVADVAGLAAQELVDWIGKALQAEAKKHTAQFAAYVQQANWWNGQPELAAIELSRVKGEGAKAETLFDAIIIIRPVLAAWPKVAKPVAFQLLPVYLLESTAAAEDFGQTLGAVFTVTLEGSWTTDAGVPQTEVLATYAGKLADYELGKPILVAAKADPLADEKKTTEFKLEDASHYFALPQRPATLGASVCYAETDPSKWVDLMAKLGAAISGEGGSANSAVKNKLEPSS